MSFFLALVAFLLGVAVGAFSHKYLAAQVKSVTGLDAQAVADQAKAKVKKVV